MTERPRPGEGHATGNDGDSDPSRESGVRSSCLPGHAEQFVEQVRGEQAVPCFTT